MTTCKDNFIFYGGQPSADIEAGRGCARMAKVVFTGCSHFQKAVEEFTDAPPSNLHKKETDYD